MIRQHTLMNAETRELTAKLVRQLARFPASSTPVTALLRMHVPSEGLSWAYAIGTPDSNAQDRWAQASTSSCDTLAKDKDNALLLAVRGRDEGAIIRLRHGFLALWGLPPKAGLLVLVAAAKSIGLVAKETLPQMVAKLDVTVADIDKLLAQTR